jgi:hypothetical protein
MSKTSTVIKKVAMNGPIKALITSMSNFFSTDAFVILVMETSKIHLSSAEMELMQNAEIILTKNRVLEKMRTLLEDVQEQQILFATSNRLNNEIFKVSPKISRGENYLGLPYLILDYPRQSSENNFFFIRTMFWWGNFFSCTLHLADHSKELFKERIIQFYPRLKIFYIAISHDQWVHQLGEKDYQKIDSVTQEQFKTICETFDHIKIAGKQSLNEWETASVKLLENWKFFLSVCGLIS